MIVVDVTLVKPVNVEFKLNVTSSAVLVDVMFVPPNSFNVSVAKATVLFAASSDWMVNAVAIEAVVTAVTKPLALTVTTGIAVVVPNVPTVLLTVAKVKAPVTAADPLKLPDVHVASPVALIVLGVVNVAADPVVFWLPTALTPGRLISALPLKLTPPIALAVANTVAESAFPVREPSKEDALTFSEPKVHSPSEASYMICLATLLTYASKPASLFPPAELTLKKSSAISTVVEFTVVVVPLTVKLPVIVASPEILIAADVISSDKKLPETDKLLLTVTSAGNPIVKVSVALTATSTSFAVPFTNSVSPPATTCVLEPSLKVNDVLMAAVEADVILP